ncbi:MAG TPA: response regulator [Bryobacteraceae bacterium]
MSRFFDDNPRRLKQFVNIFRLRAFVAYETGVLRPGRMTAEQLGKLVAMQLRWPLWTATIFNDPSFLTKLAGNSPLDLAVGEDVELKRELIGLGRYNAPPGAAWNLEGADLEAFVRISPIVRPVDLDGNRISKQQTVPDALILWVDDKPQNNESLRNIIEQSFYAQITVATSTTRALELAATTRYQLIISDMGRLDDRAAGYTLLNQLRSRGIGTPFLIFSARSTPELRAEAQRLGALDFTNRDDVVIDTVASLVTQKSMLSYSDAKSGSGPDEGRAVSA